MGSVRESKSVRVEEAKRLSASKFGGDFYQRTTYLVGEKKYRPEGRERLLDVVEGICIADYIWQRGTGKIEHHEPHTSYFGDRIGEGTFKVLRLRRPVTTYVHIREKYLMFDKPIEGRDYGK